MPGTGSPIAMPQFPAGTIGIGIAILVGVILFSLWERERPWR